MRDYKLLYNVPTTFLRNSLKGVENLNVFTFLTTDISTKNGYVSLNNVTRKCTFKCNRQMAFIIEVIVLCLDLQT